MIGLKNRNKINLVNKYRLIYLPLLIGLLAILTVSMSSYYVSKQLLIHQMKQDGMNLGRLTMRKISQEIEAMEAINSLIEDKAGEIPQQFTYQSIANSLAENTNIAYALILDTSLVAIADSDPEAIGVAYGENLQYQDALKGNIHATEWYYAKTDDKVLEIALPLYHKDVITGVLGIGLSMENVYTSIYFILLSSTLVTIIMLLLFYWSQHRNIMVPIRQLEQSIDQIDLENNLGYRLHFPEKDTFSGLTSSINLILDKIDRYLYQLKAQDDYIGHIAYYDPLTNLPNRRMFVEKLENELQQGRSGAVILLDLDNFKSINDTLGHVYGDKVLANIAGLFTSILDEHVFISRFGGDEFLILITQEEVEEVEKYANRLVNLFKNKLYIEENEIHISCSMGISLYPLHSTQVDQLIMNADLAMYKVKDFEKNNYAFFNQEMQDQLNAKVQVEMILRAALKEKAFKLLYQPQICTCTGKIVGFEALLRLKNAPISPAQFIPVAEETGMIIEIGRWVTEEIINQIALWQNKNLLVKPIAINFSAKQLNDLEYIDFLKDQLKEKNVEAKYVEIEITENLFLIKEENTVDFLNQLKSIGVGISLDDFGTGYSSLSYLTFVPVDKIKLDKSLSDKYLETKNVKVIDGIISLAHSLNLGVVAEGIEDVAQYKQLKVGKCNYIQGYLFSKPLEVEEIEKIYDHNFLDEIHGVL